MPRRPDSLCAGSCGKLIWRGTTSLPESQATCRECRRAAQPHGSVSRYKAQGCRCQVCKDGNAARMRAYAAAYRAKHGVSRYAEYRKPTTAKHGNSVRRSVRLAVYDRDGWVCQLCFEPVDPSLGPNTRFAASLDHIVCQSWGKPDHSPENLRLVHRACNSRRNNRRNAP